MNRAALALVALCLVAVCATPAAAGGAASDPLKLALQRSDFPAKLSRYSNKRWPSIEQSLAAAGFKAKAADYAAEISRGSADTPYVGGR